MIGSFRQGFRMLRPRSIIPVLALGELHLLFVSGELKTKSLPSLISAFYWGYNVRLLGFGPEWAVARSNASAGYKMTWGRQLGYKINAIREFALQLPDDDLVLYADMYDTLLAGPPSEVVAKFKRYGAEVVFAAEAFPGFRASEFPESPHRWKYLNSGGMVASAKGLKTLFSRATAPTLLLERYVGDQDWFIDMYLNYTDRSGITLDLNCELFSVACRLEGLPAHSECPAYERGLLAEGDRVRNVQTSTRPVLLHFSGSGHWPYSIWRLFGVAPIRVSTCTYWEVARALMPGVFAAVDDEPTWAGGFHYAVCTDDPLWFHDLLLLWYKAVLPFAGVFVVCRGCLAYCPLFLWGGARAVWRRSVPMRTMRTAVVLPLKSERFQEKNV